MKFLLSLVNHLEWSVGSFYWNIVRSSGFICKKNFSAPVKKRQLLATDKPAKKKAPPKKRGKKDSESEEDLFSSGGKVSWSSTVGHIMCIFNY